jgi:hypothetical protein
LGEQIEEYFVYRGIAHIAYRREYCICFSPQFCTKVISEYNDEISASHGSKYEDGWLLG